MKSIITNAYRRASSIFTGKRDHRYASGKKMNTAAKMDAEKMAADHWRYVEGVLLRHGVPCGEVDGIGDAYRFGFVSGFTEAFAHASPDDIEMTIHLVWSVYSWKMSSISKEAEHFREAFIHGWKHRMEVVG